MAKNKLSLEFDGLDEMMKKLANIDIDVKNAASEALQKSKRKVHVNLGKEMTRHNRTFKTVKSLDKNKNVKWTGTIGIIDVGFDLENDGLPSVFLMYGTPTQKPDRKLYNAIYGKKTREEVADIQREYFSKMLRRIYE